MAKTFVPTHRLVVDIPELKLSKGTLMRQVNPFAGPPDDDLLCFTEDDYKRNCKEPWVMLPQHLEPLESWPAIRQEMMDDICGGR